MNPTEKTPRQSTDALLSLVQEADRLETLFAEHAGDFTAETFPQALARHLREKGLSPMALGEQALLSKSFTYQLLSGDRVPGRDIVLRLALVLGLSVAETQALLRCAGRGALYPRVPRDAVILHALARRQTLADTAEQLAALGEVPLV